MLATVCVMSRVRRSKGSFAGIGFSFDALEGFLRNELKNNGKVEYTVGPVLIAWFNYCVLPFASEIANLLIAFAAHKSREVGYK